MVVTVEPGLALCEEIRLCDVELLLDTFHVNIGEKDIRRDPHGARSDRPPPAPARFGALRSVGYDKQIVPAG